MKVIIRRDKQTKKIIGDFGEYERLNKRGETEADIYARVEAFNKQKFRGSVAEIVELDEVAEFYRTRTLNAYKEGLDNFGFMADKLDELSRIIEDYIDEAKKAYKEEAGMKDYKRLTERDDSLCIDCAEIGFCRKTCIRQARYERLQLLENEIEDGEIDYVTDRDKEIARLTAENAKLRATLSKMETVEKELKARMEKAVELPTIYEHIIYPFVEESYTETIYYVVYRENGRVMTINCGKNKAKAEARLNELKGDM